MVLSFFLLFHEVYLFLFLSCLYFLVAATLPLLISLLILWVRFCSVRFRSHGFRLSFLWFEALTHSGPGLGVELASPEGGGGVSFGCRFVGIGSSGYGLEGKGSGGRGGWAWDVD